MCGIYCSVLSHNANNKQHKIPSDVQKLLLRRGPNQHNTISEKNIIFGGFVLWQQGHKICEQPTFNELLILLLNGDAYKISQRKPCEMSDTNWLLNELTRCKTDDEICDFFRELQGPYSIIFYNKQTECLYFARDSLGRNSLLIEKNAEELKILSTTALDEDFEQQVCFELPPLGLYKINMRTKDSVTIFPWMTPADNQWYDAAEKIKLTLQLPLDIGRSITPKWLCYNLDDNIGTYDFYEMIKVSHSSNEELFKLMLENPWLSADLKLFGELLEDSVRERIINTPKYCINCIDSLASDCNHSKVAILFSGGIDCTILAILADKFVDKNDTIDLINVAFEKVNSIVNDWNVPDRCSALNSLKDLQEICPKREWNLVEVNVLRTELNSTLRDHIKHLIYPLTTVLDESIGAAFWFASRGVGQCEADLRYNSPARVIIIGSGADELFGGYIRHRNAYHRFNGTHQEKLCNVLAELTLDWERIPSRNLARDDRVIADNGKTSRAPFIEENLVHFVQNRKSYQRCCFLLEDGVGDKLFLRIYGYTLGLRFSVSLKKRAIQFGSRIANKKQNAKDQSEFFKA